MEIEGVSLSSILVKDAMVNEADNLPPGGGSGERKGQNTNLKWRVGSNTICLRS